MIELINKATTNTYVEEKRVWSLYRHTALRVSAALHLYGLKTMRKHVMDAIKRSDNMIATAPSNSSTAVPETLGVGAKTPTSSRPLCS